MHRSCSTIYFWHRVLFCPAMAQHRFDRETSPHTMSLLSWAHQLVRCLRCTANEQNANHSILKHMPVCIVPLFHLGNSSTVSMQLSTCSSVNKARPLQVLKEPHKHFADFHMALNRRCSKSLWQCQLDAERLTNHWSVRASTQLRNGSARTDGMAMVKDDPGCRPYGISAGKSRWKSSATKCVKFLDISIAIWRLSSQHRYRTHVKTVVMWCKETLLKRWLSFETFESKMWSGNSSGSILLKSWCFDREG